MENEIMNYENEVFESEVYETESENTGIGTGLAMLIGAGITAAGVAVVSLGKKLWVNYKAKKELRLVDQDEFIEADDDRVNSVTK